MAVGARHTCARCGKFVRGRCPGCTRKLARDRDARRPSASARGYDWEWAQFADRWLSRFPWCGQRADGELHRDDSACVQIGQRVYADCVDHIVAQAAGGRRYDPTNLQSLCTACNLRKNVATEGGFGRPKVTR